MGAQPILTGAEQRGFLRDNLGQLAGEDLGSNEHALTAGFGSEPDGLNLPCLQFQLVLLQLGAREAVVDTDQRCSGSDTLAFADENFRNDAALKMLDDLVARLRHHATCAARDLVEGGQGRPAQHENGAGNGGIDQMPLAARGDGVAPPWIGEPGVSGHGIVHGMRKASWNG